MNYKRFVNFCLLTFLMMLGAVHHSYASDLEVDDLKNQILLLQNKLDELNRELKSKTANNRNIRLEAGPILDLWLVEKDITDIPSSLSIGRTVDEGELFGYGSFLADKNLKAFYKKPVGLLWSGLLNIEEEGEYNILHEFNIESTQSGSGWSYHLYSNLKIGEVEIVENTARANAGNDGTYPVSTNVLLKKGRHKFELWLAANWIKHGGMSFNYELEPKNISVNIKLRNSKMMAPMKITKDMLFHAVH